MALIICGMEIEFVTDEQAKELESDEIIYWCDGCDQWHVSDDKTMDDVDRALGFEPEGGLQ